MVLKSILVREPFETSRGSIRFNSKAVGYNFINRNDIKAISIDVECLTICFSINFDIKIEIEEYILNKIDDVLVFRIRGFIIDKIDSHEETTVEELISEIKELIYNHGN